MVKRAEKLGQITNTACSSQASIPMFNHSNGNPFLLGALSGSPATTAPNGDHWLSTSSLFNNDPDITETFSAKRKRLQSKPCKVYHVTANPSLPLRGLNTSEGYDPFCATKERKDNKSPNKSKRTTSPTHCSGGPRSHNTFTNNSNSATSAAILPSSNSILEELGAFSIFCHSDDTNLLHNFDRGGSRYFSQADHVGTDVSSDVGSHVNRDWLTRRFHPPDQTEG